MLYQLKQRTKNIIYPLSVKFGWGSKKAYLYLAQNIPGWVTTEELGEKWDYSFNIKRRYYRICNNCKQNQFNERSPNVRKDDGTLW